MREFSFIELNLIGIAVRKEVKRQADLYDRAGSMAVQDSWDASVGQAAVDEINRIMSGDEPKV